ncbi:MAG: gamma-glutamyl-gamma-aminobutyrate hydrolase family protein, partial [Clostridia bacterium]|nr:gamma-glutamyl-gamma-aminobutyrate hydrolase family protein [Clostridia bacterium]
MKPKILIVGEDGFAMDTGHYVLNLAYARAITEAGGLPLLAFDWNSTAEYLDLADGLFLTGGPDLLCYRWGEYYKDFSEMPPFSRTRDDLDFELCNRFLQAGKPILGVGRGCEVINVALGGTLYKDIEKATGKAHPDENAPKGGWNATTEQAAFSFHSVAVQENTRLSALLGSTLQVS